jgi:hypothetical protein
MIVVAMFHVETVVYTAVVMFFCLFGLEAQMILVE